MPLFLTIVLDGVGIGAQPDAAQYGDEDSNTLGHVCLHAAPDLPNLTRLGLGCIAPLANVPCVDDPEASFGKMREASAGKDSTTGHWELAGVETDQPFPTYPNGFPDDVIERFIRLTECEGVLGNRAASGTEIIEELGPEHVRTGYPIVYTSADSVFQIAAHDEVISLDALYQMCLTARDRVCTEPHAVGRVIARPFTGSVGSYYRLSHARKDYSLRPASETVQEALQARNIRTVSIGKVNDLFGGVGFQDRIKTESNSEGILATLQELRRYDGEDVFIWVNLVDFDQEFGHRNDPDGFARALEEFDRAIPDLIAALPVGGQFLITADHGNDPTTPSTDHSREYVPVLLYDGGPGVDIGVRPSFIDHAATVAAYFEVPLPKTGMSFLRSG